MKIIQKGTPFILYLLVTLSPLGIDLHLPALINIKNYFGITENMAQLSILFFVFSMGTGQLLFGFMAQKKGKKKIGYSGAILFISGSVGVLFSINYNSLLLFRTLQGLGASALSIIAYAAVNENYNEKEASIIFSIQSGFLNIVPAVAPVIGALLLALLNWKIIFIFFILYGAVTLFLFNKNYNYTDISSNMIY